LVRGSGEPGFWASATNGNASESGMASMINWFRFNVFIAPLLEKWKLRSQRGNRLTVRAHRKGESAPGASA
jgi:hypothetical protein